MTLGSASGITPLGSDLASVLCGPEKKVTVMVYICDQFWVSAMDEPKLLVIKYAMFNDSEMSQAVPLRTRLGVLSLSELKNKICLV
jgi:hypothetical protein